VYAGAAVDIGWEFVGEKQRFHYWASRVACLVLGRDYTQLNGRAGLNPQRWLAVDQHEG
jgi:hypothetical protein